MIYLLVRSSLSPQPVTTCLETQLPVVVLGILYKVPHVLKCESPWFLVTFLTLMYFTDTSSSGWTPIPTWGSEFRPPTHHPTPVNQTLSYLVHFWTYPLSEYVQWHYSHIPPPLVTRRVTVSRRSPHYNELSMSTTLIVMSSAVTCTQLGLNSWQVVL